MSFMFYGVFDWECTKVHLSIFGIQENAIIPCSGVSEDLMLGSRKSFYDTRSSQMEGMMLGVTGWM